MLNEEITQRVENIKSTISIPNIAPGFQLGSNTCPACGGVGKFSVWQQYAKCWRTSCELNKGLDVIGFYRYQNQLQGKGSFFQALQELEGEGNLPNLRNLSNHRCELLEDCLNIYSFLLWQPEGEQARDYLRQRGFLEETLRQYRIGFAPHNHCLREFHVDESSLRREGLLNGNREFYSHRIIFPILNTDKQPIHLVGRYLGEVPKNEKGEELLPRYKDTPGRQGLPGTKSYLAFEHFIDDYLKADSGSVVVTEGYPDALSLLQVGIPSLGILGLEKLARHASKLKHFQQITFLFDNDKYPADHPRFPLEYKSWRRIIPQLIELQMLLPHTKFFIWMVPESVLGVKDINDWINICGLDSQELLPTIECDRQELITSLIQSWGSDLSKHFSLLKLLVAVGRPPEELQPYIPSEVGAANYAARVFTS